jgi:hypothetical protein
MVLSVNRIFRRYYINDVNDSDAYVLTRTCFVEICNLSMEVSHRSVVFENGGRR